MVEQAWPSREKLIAEYRLIFTKYPELKMLAQEYWNRTQTLEPSPSSIEQEDQALIDTVDQMVDSLMNSPTFIQAMKKASADLFEGAIAESLIMIDIVQDL